MKFFYKIKTKKAVFSFIGKLKEYTTETLIYQTEAGDAIKVKRKDILSSSLSPLPLSPKQQKRLRGYAAI